MTDAAEIVSDLRVSVQMLIDLDRPEATRAASVITRLLAGEDFETAADLPAGWRRSLQLSVRDAVLAELLPLFDRLHVPDRARRIAQGVARAASNRGQRPTGEAGFYFDLHHAGIELCARSWRQVLKNRGNCNSAISAPIRQRPQKPEATWQPNRKQQ